DPTPSHAMPGSSRLALAFLGRSRDSAACGGISDLAADLVERLPDLEGDRRRALAAGQGHPGRIEGFPRALLWNSVDPGRAPARGAAHLAVDRDQVDLALGPKAWLQRRRARCRPALYPRHGAIPHGHVRLDACLQVCQEIQEIPLVQQQHVEFQPAHHKVGAAGWYQPGIVERSLGFEVVPDLEELAIVFDPGDRFDPVEAALLAHDTALAHLLV